MDVNYWGWFCVPIGLVIGFGPVLVAAAIVGYRNAKADQSKKS